jgi:hypothetical protein
MANPFFSSVWVIEGDGDLSFHCRLCFARILPQQLFGLRLGDGPLVFHVLSDDAVDMPIADGRDLDGIQVASGSNPSKCLTRSKPA